MSQVSHKYPFMDQFFSKRDEARPKESSSLTRSYASNTERTTVIFRTLATISTRHSSQDHLSQGTSQQLGLVTIYRCLISPFKTMDLQHLTKNNSSILWLHKTSEIHVDASEYGLGVALLQNYRPIALASKTLTHVETRYANIECECLSVVFGLETFHMYIYGCQITVFNDHKPLEMIQINPIHAAPPCLQRMLLRLQKYDCNIVYKPGKEMILDGRLSRFQSRSENLPIELHHNIQHVTFTNDKINIIRGATERDPILHAVYCITLNGWPTRFSEVPCITHQFWSAGMS